MIVPKPVLLLMLLALGFGQGVFGQSKKERIPPDRFLIAGAGWTNARVLDLSTSPLVYSGSMFSGRASYLQNGKKNSYYGDLAYDFGYLYSPQFGITHFAQQTAYGYGGTLGYRRLFIKAFKDNLEFRAGGNLNFQGGIRQHSLFSNNATNFDHSFSVRLSGDLQYRFRFLKQEWVSGMQLDLPVIAAMLRPGFVATNPEPILNPENKKLKGILQSLEWASWNRYRASLLRFHLDYVLPNQNRLRLSYDWDYYRMDTRDRIQSSRQSLYLSLLFNI
jgi:hypothetical protein